VQKGFARGKSLGVPTANLKCDDQLIPADGVYVGRCAVAGRVYPAAVSIGTMPTFGDCDRQIEAHLVGFDGDLYGTALSVEMVDWIRPQRAYDGIEPLMRQIQKDIAQTVRGFGRDSSRPIASTRLPASNLGRFA
ncbi:MAG: riboflavin kinase, partial [Tepidisphaeraceae bacterium]